MAKEKDTIHVCPWCNRSLPESTHTVNQVFQMWVIGCPYYLKQEPTFLSKDLYRIESHGKLKH